MIATDDSAQLDKSVALRQILSTSISSLDLIDDRPLDSSSKVVLEVPVKPETEEGVEPSYPNEETEKAQREAAEKALVTEPAEEKPRNLTRVSIVTLLSHNLH